MKSTNAVPVWKRGKKPLHVWLNEGTKKFLKEAARKRELPLRKLISDILERAAKQL